MRAGGYRKIDKDMVDHNIDCMGFFTNGNGIATFFFMKIDQRDNFNISGTIEDELGKAVFLGELTYGTVKFNKEYLNPIGKMAKNPIRYVGRRIENDDRIFRGTYYSAGSQDIEGEFILEK